LKAKEVERSLRKKGFEPSNKDHRQFWFYIDGEKTNIRTMASHNSQEIDNFLQARMAEQMHLTKNEFLLFVSCKISESDYTKKLKADGVIS